MPAFIFVWYNYSFTSTQEAIMCRMSYLPLMSCCTEKYRPGTGIIPKALRNGDTGYSEEDYMCGCGKRCDICSTLEIPLL